MPAQHDIDDGLRVIITTWTGAAADAELMDALRRYHQEIRSRYPSYDELVDFSQTSRFDLSTEGLINLARTASREDVARVKTKLAIVVPTLMSYGLGRMYEIYRGLILTSTKEVRVFRDIHEAQAWMQT